jgi:hypothetical protein
MERVDGLAWMKHVVISSWSLIPDRAQNTDSELKQSRFIRLSDAVIYSRLGEVVKR